MAAKATFKGHKGFFRLESALVSASVLSAPQRARRADLWLAGLSGLVALAPAVVFYASPLAYGRLVIEDWWGESATFFALAMAAVLFGVGVGRAHKPLEKAGFAALAAVSVFLAGEEVSWGQRFFGYRTPDAVSRVNVQGEFNFHNIDPDAMIPVYGVIGAALVVYGLLLPALVNGSSRVRGAVCGRGMPMPPLSLSPLFVAPLIYVAVDLFPRTDEVFEWLVSAALLGMAMALAVDGQRARLRSAGQGPRSGWLRTGAVAAAWATAFSAGVVLSAVSKPILPYESVLRLHASFYLPEAGFPRQAERLFKQLESFARPGELPRVHLDYGQFLREQGRSGAARRAFEDAREGAEKALARSPGRLVNLEVAAFACDELGDSEGRDRAGRAAIDVLSARLARLDSGDAGEPGAVLWSRTANSRDSRARTLTRRARLHLLLEDCAPALQDLADAASIVEWADTARTLAKLKREVRATCPAVAGSGMGGTTPGVRSSETRTGRPVATGRDRETRSLFLRNWSTRLKPMLPLASGFAPGC